MSDTDDTTPAEEPAEEPGDNPGAEAAKYRRRLRETEKARDELAARVETLQRQNIEAQLVQERLTPKALWATTTLADLLTEDGSVDPDKVKQAAQAARTELGIGSGLYVPAEGTLPSTPPTDSFKAAFRPNNR